MVAINKREPALRPPDDDLSWLFEAERGAVAVHPTESGAFIVKGTQTLYRVTLDPPSCECDRWVKARKICFHIREARRPPTKLRCGICPECGSDLVTDLSYREGKGYVLRSRCWESYADGPCGYSLLL